MFQPISLLAIICLYVTALFLIALWVERGSPRARQFARSPYTYSMALAVYCTSWTYYGSVGNAATQGPLFLTIYLGPTLAIVFWGAVVRKMVRLKNVHRITSIADLISARYDKSQSLAALATAVAMVGTMPYVALQLRAVTSTFQLLASTGGPGGTWLATHVGAIVVVFMTIFTIVFGARRLDPTERHEGLMLALAVECAVKLVAFLIAGCFVTFFLFDGPADLFQQIADGPARDFLSMRYPPLDSAFVFCSFLVLAMSAIQFLPRQFHVVVVENSNERHVKTATWLLPLYLLLINLFVIPIAGAAVMRSSDLPIDTYVLQLPRLEGNHLLSMMVFLGGFSAATGMIVVEAMAVSTMVTNHLLLPIIESTPRLGFLRRYLLRVRWAAIAGVLVSGYLFDQALGHSYTLVNIGIISFAAVIQFAPALLGGLYWRNGTGRGALMGLAAGSLVWFYTMLLPSLVRGGRLPMSLVTDGPFGISLLRPEQLFGLVGVDRVPHGLFWSLFCNAGLYVLGSLLWEPSVSEQRIAESFVGVMGDAPARRRWDEDEASIDLAAKRPMIGALLRRYFSPTEAEEIQLRCETTLGLPRTQPVSVGALAALYGELERVLAGSIGAAAAHQAVRHGLSYTAEELGKLPRVYARILANLKVSPGELKRRIDYYQERASILEAQATLLEARVEERTRALQESNQHLQAEIIERKRAEQDLSRSNAELEQFAYVASHDLQEPLRMIASYVQLLERRYKDRLDEDANEFIGFAVDGARRMQSLINDLLLFARIGTRGKPFTHTDCKVVLTRVLHDLRLAIEESGATVTIGELPGTIVADEVQMQQLFRNLIGNALKFRSGAPPTVSVKSERHADEWRVDVADNGIGIEPRYFDQLFRLFHRLHTRTAYPGNGIGLALCKKIVERHGGRIWVQSSAGAGTTFSFTIPDRAFDRTWSPEESAPGRQAVVGGAATDTANALDD